MPMVHAMVLLLGVACAPSRVSEPPPESVDIAQVPLPSREVATTRYVTASRLNLRREPREDADRAGRIRINSPVEVVEHRDDWVRVRVMNGSEGWVAVRFLSTERLTLEGAMARAAEASGADALVWWQRAAAIEPMSPIALEGLAQAYRDGGDEASAQRVERQLGWPEALFLVTGGNLVEWSNDFDYGQPMPEDEEPLTATQRRAFNLSTDASWSVLPDQGAPVPATVTAARFMYRTGCSADVVVTLELDFDLPEGRVPLVAARGPTPPSWNAASPVPAMSRDAAMAALTRAATERGYTTEPEFHGLGVGPDGDGWFGRAAWLPRDTRLSEADGIMWPSLTGFDARVAADGTVQVVGEHSGLDSLSIVTPRGRRDITGDGHPETVWASECTEVVSKSDGAILAGTAFRCCGC